MFYRHKGKGQRTVSLLFPGDSAPLWKEKRKKKKKVRWRETCWTVDTCERNSSFSFFVHTAKTANCKHVTYRFVHSLHTPGLWRTSGIFLIRGHFILKGNQQRLRYTRWIFMTVLHYNSQHFLTVFTQFYHLFFFSADTDKKLHQLHLLWIRDSGSAQLSHIRSTHVSGNINE